MSGHGSAGPPLNRPGRVDTCPRFGDSPFLVHDHSETRTMIWGFQESGWTTPSWTLVCLGGYMGKSAHRPTAYVPSIGF